MFHCFNTFNGVGLDILSRKSIKPPTSLRSQRIKTFYYSDRGDSVLFNNLYKQISLKAASTLPKGAACFALDNENCTVIIHTNCFVLKLLANFSCKRGVNYWKRNACASRYLFKRFKLVSFLLFNEIAMSSFVFIYQAVYRSNRKRSGIKCTIVSVARSFLTSWSK